MRRGRALRPCSGGSAQVVGVEAWYLGVRVQGSWDVGHGGPEVLLHLHLALQQLVTVMYMLHQISYGRWTVPQYSPRVIITIIMLSFYHVWSYEVIMITMVLLFAGGHSDTIAYDTMHCVHRSRAIR